MTGPVRARILPMPKLDTEELWTHGTLKETLDEVREQTEREMIALALKYTGGNVTRSAELLGISRRGIQVKIKRWGLDPAEYGARN